MSTQQAESALELLAQGGYLQTRPAFHPAGSLEWNTTLAGGALTMASFAKPITRAKADTLLAGVLARAEAYNADDTKPYLITTIAVFGSYLREEVDPLGDLDLHLTTVARQPESDSADNLLDYSGSSGRRFNTFVDQLTWGLTEVKQVLRARSGYINIHTEDISRFTQDSRVVFPLWTGDRARQSQRPSTDCADE